MKTQAVTKYWIHHLLLLLAVAARSQAAIVHKNSGAIDIPVTHAGVYLNVEDGTTFTNDNFINSKPWDLNFYFGGEKIVSNVNFHPVENGPLLVNMMMNLELNTVVGDDMPEGYYYGTAINSSDSHIGNEANQFTSGSPGYLGFRFLLDEDYDNNPNSSDYLYGWLRVTLDFTGNIGTIHEWAYEDVVGESILVGDVGAVVPEPAAYAWIVGLISATCVGMRRRGRN